MPDLAPLLTPDRHELVELVRDLHSQASPWIPSGLGNHLHWGPQPQIQSSVLSLRGHNQVLEHATGDFTVTVEAGMPLGELQAVLAEQGQWLPIDPPLAGPSSIGGVVARGVSGPLRHKAMGLKDQVIGISLLRSDGTTAQAGGQVVKNVAGYDLSRLMAGAHGTLGVLLEISLKVLPTPRTQATRVFEHNAEQALAAFSSWAARPWPISATYWEAGRTYLRLSGATSSVDAAAQALGGEPVADLVRREALEEAGVEIGAMRRVAHYMPSPGGSNERLQVFVGRADLSNAGGVHGVVEENEDIRVVVRPVSEVEALLRSGRVDNAASLITLQWLLLHRDTLDREWGAAS